MDVLAQDSPPDFFIEAVIDNPTPYLGEQITYTVRRYQAAEFPSLPYYQDHPFTGFWDIPLIQRPAYTTTVAGREYTVRPTNIAIFPTLPGPNTIAPTKLVIPGDGGQADTIIESQPIDVNVRPLPNGAPPDFAGAVGQFELNTRFVQPEGNIDDSLTLIVDISGTGNVEIVNQPFFPDVPTWRLFDSEVTTDVPLSLEKVKGTRQFAWTVVANQTGQQQFPPVVLSYFDPESSSYQTIRTEPLPVNILPVEQPLSATPPPAVEEELPLLLPLAEIGPLKGIPTTLGQTSRSIAIIQSPLVWLCTLLPLLVIGLALIGQVWRTKRAASGPSVRQKRAKRKAQSVLDLAKDPDSDPYTIVNRALTGYLSDKLDQNLTGLTSVQLMAHLNSFHLPEELQQQIRETLNQVDAGRFAPKQHAPAARQKLITEANTLIDRLESFFKKRR